MNFLPEDYVEKRQAARAAIAFIGLLLAVVGGVVGAYLFSQHHMKPLVREHDRVNQEFEDASKQIADVQELEKQKERMVSKADIITTLMERVRRSTLLGELTNLRPKGVEFISVDLKSKELSAPAHPLTDIDRARQAANPAEVKAPPVDVTVNLVGTAPADSEVSAYMSALQRSPLVTGVTLLFSEELKKDKDSAPVRKFNLEFHINPDADLRGSSTTVVEASQKN
jgi:Tfp pilus assembly protein PilN